MSIKFDVGDRVIMLSTSQYKDCCNNPHGVEGTITSYYDNHEKYNVTWDNGNWNGCYFNTDIELVVDNVNHVKVNLSTYKDDSNLTAEDKKVIAKYVKNNNLIELV